jgi:hypothetical protein
MPVEDHPIYAKWRAALEMVIATREARDTFRPDSPEYRVADAEHQAALRAYDKIAREV